METIVGGVLILGILAGLIAFMIGGPTALKKIFSGTFGFGDKQEKTLGGFPANVLLIATTAMLALEIGAVTGNAGTGLSYMIIVGACVLIAIFPNLAAAVLGTLGLFWAVPRMIAEYGSGVVLPILLISVLGSILARILSRG